MLRPSHYNEDEEDERAAIGADLHDLAGPHPVVLLPGEAALLPPPPPSSRSVYRGRILLDEIQTKVLRVFILAIQSHPLQICTEI
jgi:hypothetical protein